MPSIRKSTQIKALTQGNSFIDLFAGSGGLSLGLMLGGWRGLLAVEKDKFAFETLKHNLIEGNQGVRYEWPSWFPQAPCRIERFTKKYKKQIAKLRGKVTLIAGGPPCQGVSVAGKRDRSDHRNTMFRRYVEVVEMIRPPFLLLENVKGIENDFHTQSEPGRKKRTAARQAKRFSEHLSESIEALGYHVYPGLLKAVDFGVPQLRPRYFMFAVHKSVLASKDQLNPYTFVDRKRAAFLRSKSLPVDRPVTAKQALSDLETKGKSLIECLDSTGFRQITYKGPRTKYQKLLHSNTDESAPNSLRLANHRKETRARFAKILKSCKRGRQLSKEDRKRFKLKKHVTVPLDPNKPSLTLTTLPDDILHYSEPRILSVREYARLQSFPDWFQFCGNYTTGGERRVRECPRYTQVGNAVPPLLAELLGLVLKTLRQRLAKAYRTK